jgi:hypothetical protein
VILHSRRNRITPRDAPWSAELAPEKITLHRIAVIGPNPPCGVLTDERFVELLSSRLGIEAFSLHPSPGLFLAAADAPLEFPPASAGAFAGPILRVGADTLVWLRFSPGVYLRDWLAGWFDVLLNGSQGMRRRAGRARLIDVLRSLFFRHRDIAASSLEGLRARVLLVELASPAQARFWLKMQEERVRETQPPRS